IACLYCIQTIHSHSNFKQTPARIDSYNISLHDALPIFIEIKNKLSVGDTLELLIPNRLEPESFKIEKLWDIETEEEIDFISPGRSEEHTSELQSRFELVCRLLLEKKKTFIST